MVGIITNRFQYCVWFVLQRMQLMMFPFESMFAQLKPHFIFGLEYQRCSFSYHVSFWNELGYLAMLLLLVHNDKKFSICISKNICALFVDALIHLKRESSASQKGPKVGN